MCGIVGYIGNKKATPILINGLLRLEYRGYDSAGISTIEKEGLSVMKDKGRVKNLNEINGIDKLEGTIQRFNTNMMLAYKEKADSYLLYFLLSLVVLATTVITFTIVLMKKKKHKTKFA